MAARILERLGEAGGLVVEVGCGQGGFLKRLVGMGSTGRISGVGFDPSFRGNAGPAGADVICYANTFSRATLNLLPTEPDVLLARHVIEHVPDPVGFLRSCVDALPAGRSVSLFLETPSMEWILENIAFFDVFYEHCSYFSKSALIVAASMGGLCVRSVQRVFGGQYYFLEAAGGHNELPLDTPNTMTEIERFAAAEMEARQYWRTRIAEANKQGAVAVWGAAAKGMTFINLLDPDCELVDGIIDVNPRKQGRFAPLTAHPIYSLATALQRGVKTAFLMNPNYLDEVRDMVRHANGKMEVIPVQGWSCALHN
jgi:SAM-dependent methyltransferase